MIVQYACTLQLHVLPARLGSGLSYGTADNSATIHGSPGLFRRDQGGYFGGSRPSSRSRYSSYGGYSPSSGSADEVQKETKYYYGGKYQGDLTLTVKESPSKASGGADLRFLQPDVHH